MVLSDFKANICSVVDCLMCPYFRMHKTVLVSLVADWLTTLLRKEKQINVKGTFDLIFHSRAKIKACMQLCLFNAFSQFQSTFDLDLQMTCNL